MPSVRLAAASLVSAILLAGSAVAQKPGARQQAEPISSSREANSFVRGPLNPYSVSPLEGTHMDGSISGLLRPGSAVALHPERCVWGDCSVGLRLNYKLPPRVLETELFFDIQTPPGAEILVAILDPLTGEYYQVNVRPISSRQGAFMVPSLPTHDPRYRAPVTHHAEVLLMIELPGASKRPPFRGTDAVALKRVTLGPKG